MKMRPSFRLRLLVLIGLLVWQPVFTGGELRAQSDTDTKVRLYADALRAYDTGQYATALNLVNQLLVIVPGDQNVLGLKTKIEAAVAAQPSVPAPAPAAPAPAATPPPAIPPSRIAAQPAPRNEDQRRVAAAAPAPASTPAPDTRSVVEQETQRINDAIARAREIQRLARAQASRGENAQALSSFDYAIDLLLPPNPLTESLIAELRAERARLAGQPAPQPREIDEPVEQGITPSFAFAQRVNSELLERGRAQYLAGDVNGAEATFKELEARDPNSSEAKDFLRRIAESRRDAGWIDREKTREQMLEETSRAWQRPQVFQERPTEVSVAAGPAPLLEKLNRIVIPDINFPGVALAPVISTLISLSEEFDTTGVGPRGVNIVLIDPERRNPLVNLQVRGLPLRRVLDFIVDSVGFQYEVQLDAVVVRPGGELSNLETEFFPISRATVGRMVTAQGLGDDRGVSAAAATNPFASDSTSSSATTGPTVNETEAIRGFLQQAGVNFDGTAGASLVYDGSELIVTHTSRNLGRIRNILNRYNNVRQVEIEAKFMDVAEGALEEAGVEWLLNRQGERYNETYRSANRTLEGAFSPSTGQSSTSIIIPGQPGTPGTPETRLTLPVSPPTFPGGIDVGIGAEAVADIIGTIGSFDVEAVIRALSRKTGSDLLSAPKVTVMSGNLATITVAQEFRYPEQYGDIESQVGQAGGSSLVGGGAAGVTITAGTPQDFQTRNVGVELFVTPTVEQDDYSISLELNPRVTEFDGFVEYGGTSVAISGGTTVTVPSGFFQPIFSVREVKTNVMVWDGATVVMGGLTREEVRRVNDKVPILGDVPLVGRLFRSEGESNQKRNLLIFVTANLISPGGSLKKQDVRGVTPNSLFQNPTIVTPGGSVDRSRR